MVKEVTIREKYTFYDFFAGIGLVSLGLKPQWECLWANDIDPKKEEIYRHNFPQGNFIRDDIANIFADSIPGIADMAWSSFPCQDLSLAGPRVGMDGSRSSTFWEFLRVLRELKEARRLPMVIVVENVIGLLRTTNLSLVCEGLAELGLNFGALVIDAKFFIPQSRPRVFIIATSPELAILSRLAKKDSTWRSPWTPRSLVQAFEALPPRLKERWVWWQLPSPPLLTTPLTHIFLSTEDLSDAPWHSYEETKRFLDMMSSANLAKVHSAKTKKTPVVGTIYRRVRDGQQRAEIRIDGLAGCLRASRAGSSRLFLMFIEGEKITSRRLSAREAARLMGVDDNYWLPPRYSDAYHAVADGVAVPVVRWLSNHLLEPLVHVGRTSPIVAKAR